MRITLFPCIAMILATFVHFGFCFLFIRGLDWGIIGLAWASSIKDTVLVCTVMVYGCCSSKVNKALVPINMDAFRGWGEYLRVALPSTVMMCSEWWGLEILTILAGILGVTELASITIFTSV